MKKMKKVVWVFSLSVMLFTQLMTPFAYATGDVAPVEEAVVEELAAPAKDVTKWDETIAWEVVVEQPEKKSQPEADFSVGGGW